jgi:putative transposase
MSTEKPEQAFLVTLWTYGGAPLLAAPDAAHLFCRVLAHVRERLGLRLHAYVVLPDRVRLILAARDEDPGWVRVAAQRLKSRFAREWNARTGRLGLVWQDAEQRLPLGGAADVRRRAEMLHRSPVLAGLAPHPAAWRYSSIRAWAGNGRPPAPVDLPDGPAAPPRSGHRPAGPQVSG